MKPPIIRLLKDPTPFLKFDPLHSTEKCISKEGPTCKLLQQVSKSTAAALFLHGTLVYNLHNVLKNDLYYFAHMCNWGKYARLDPIQLFQLLID